MQDAVNYRTPLSRLCLLGWLSGWLNGEVKKLLVTLVARLLDYLAILVIRFFDGSN